MCLILINRNNTLSKEYVPDGLVQYPGTKIWLRKEAYDGFCSMNQAIKGSGLSRLVLVSGYRSYDYQQEVFNRKVSRLINEGWGKEHATAKASTIVALPGTSEHQSGLAIDVTSERLAQEKDPLVEEFEQTKQVKWLNINAQEYGFILRYPKDKTKITHITYEPWHYRYVGIHHAKIIKQANLSLEEYVAYLDKN